MVEHSPESEIKQAIIRRLGNKGVRREHLIKDVGKETGYAQFFIKHVYKKMRTNGEIVGVAGSPGYICKKEL